MHAAVRYLALLSVLAGMLAPARIAAAPLAIAQRATTPILAPPAALQPVTQSRTSPMTSAPVPQPQDTPTSQPAHARSAALLSSPTGGVSSRSDSTGVRAPSVGVLADGPVTVNSRANIFAAGQSTVGSPDGGGGQLPPSISLPAGTGRTLTFPTITGQPAFCGVDSCKVNPDGKPAPPNLFTYIVPRIPAQSGDTPSAVSGIKHSSAVMFLVGVFLDGATPSGPLPTTMSYSSAAAPGTLQDDAALFAPVLRQTFFIGDGKTGAGSGITQQFIVPDGATRLFLGFADGDNLGSGFMGTLSPAPPSHYDDNLLTATLSVNFQVVATNPIVPPGQRRGPAPCHCDPHADIGQPVNTRTGNYWTRTTDLAVQTPGPALVWTRTYNSQAITETTDLIGYGWTHPFATHLITPSFESGRVIILSPEGNELRFDDLGNQRDFRPYPGVYSSLILANGVYTQTLRDQQQLVFAAASGRLIRTRDAQGRQLTLTYNGSNQLTQITDAGDSTRTLIVGYTSGRITSVSDGVRTVQYGYDTTNGNLTSVTDVMGRVTTYTYQTPTNHLLTKITNALGQDIEQMSYDTATPPRVSSQTLQDHQQLQFGYLAASTTITTTGLDGRRDVQRFDYASNNTLTAISNRTNPNQPQQLWATSFDSTISPSSVTDGNGHTTNTSSTYNGLPVQTKDALGQTSYTFYDPATNSPASTVDALGVTSRFRYDSFNNLISTTVGITTTSLVSATTVYTYNQRYAGKNWLEGMRTPDGVSTRYDYNTHGQLITTTLNYQNGVFDSAKPDEDLITTYGYDAVGRVMTTTVGVGSLLVRKDITVYNADNTVAKNIQNYKDGSFTPAKADEDITTAYGYDKLGRTVAMTDTLGHITATRYTADGRLEWTERNISSLQFDSKGQPLYRAYRADKPDLNVATLYGYDGLGRTVLVSQTGILTGGFTLTPSPQFTSVYTQVTRTEYDTLSRPVTVTLDYRGANLQTITQYDGAGNVIHQRDALGRWSYTDYDLVSRPVTVTLNYQDGKPLTAPRDADILSVTRYDRAGRVAQRIDNYVDGKFTATEPITDRVTLYQYDTLDRVITTTVNYTSTATTHTDLNRISLMGYDTKTTRLLGQRDPLGRWTGQQYDRLGRVTTTIQNCRDAAQGAPPLFCAAFTSAKPDRNVPTTTRYDALGRAFETVDAQTHVSHTDFDGLGRATRTVQNYQDGSFTGTKPDEDVSVAYRYDALGRTLAMTDVLTFATQYAINALGQTTAVTDTVGRVTRMGYDGAGALRWVQRPDGQITVYQVDGLGRVVATIANYANGQRDASDAADQDVIARTVYDAAGRRTQQIQRADPADRVTTFAYDNLDQLIGVTEHVVSGACAQPPCNVVTQYQYDRASNRTAIVDATSHIRRFSYDAAREQTSASDPVNPSTTWDYDAGGRVIAQHDPRGSTYDLTFGYDARDLITKTQSLQLTAPITATYDALGRRLGMGDASGATSFSYDALGRMLSATAPNTGLVSYTYDGRGSRTKLTYPGGATALDYFYTNDGRLQTVKQGTTTLATYAYDSVARLAQVARSNNTVTNYGYDRSDQLRAVRTTEAGTTIGGFQYQSDRLGLRTVVTETLPLTPTISPTRIKTITFEGASLIDPTTGADSVQQTATAVSLESTTPLKGSYSALIPNTANSYLREDITGVDELYVSFYLKLNALPSSTARIAMIANSGTTVGNLQLTSSGIVQLRNSSTTIGSSASSLTVGTLYRLAIHQKNGTGANGVLEAYLATGDASFGPAFAFSTTQSFTTQATRVQIGATTGTAANLVVDDITLDSGILPPSSLRATRQTPTAGPDAGTPTATASASFAPAAAVPAARPLPDFGRLPLAFTPNTGQSDASVRYQVRGLGGRLFFTPGDLVLVLPIDPRPRASRPGALGNGVGITATQTLSMSVVRMSYQGAGATTVVTGTEPLPGRVNELIGSDLSGWHTNLPTYAEIAYPQLYPGISVRYNGMNGQLSRIYTLAPGADATRLRWRYQGAQEVRVDSATGNLQILLTGPGGGRPNATTVYTLTESAPLAWQTINEQDVMVAVRYVVAPDGSASFALGSYDHSQPLTIDPILTYSTYLGGGGPGTFGEDEGLSIAVDRAGNAYITGYTYSSSFPTGTPLQGSIAGSSDIFVAKLNAAGSALVYSTYLGGSSADGGLGIAVDSVGSAYILGNTFSTNIPLVNAQQSTYAGAQDAFVAKLNAAGSALVYSTYLGGSNIENAHGIAVDSTGNAYVTGNTNSTNFPTTNPMQAANAGSYDAFVTKLSATGARVYSTYLGGSNTETSFGIAVDGSGNAYLAGQTSSTNFPTTNPMQGTLNGSDDAFVTKLNAAGSARVYSTYLGGSSSEEGAGIAVWTAADGTTNAYVTGFTSSTNFPTTSPLQGSYGGNNDAFVTKLNTAGTARIYSTYLGGAGFEYGWGIAVDGTGSAYVTGQTTGSFPLANAIQATYGGGADDAFVVQVNTAGSARSYSTYLGGSNDEVGFGIAADSAGNAYVTGRTGSTNFPTVNPLQVGYAGGTFDAFAAKISPTTLLTGTRTITYTYDGLLRLARAEENPGRVYTYTFDLAGNRTDAWVNGIPAEPHRSYDAANQVIGWTYDAAGNLTKDDTGTYGYNALNRVTTVTALGHTRVYTYNGDGVLVKQTADGTTTRYAQDLAAPLSQMLQAQGGTTIDYLYGLDRLASSTATVRTWYVADALGSVRRTVSDSGTPNVPIDYDPWGAPEIGTVPTFGFTGEQQDVATGLVNLRARWYHSVRGMFTIRDPARGNIEYPMSFNPYLYGWDDPVNRIDPSGLNPWATVTPAEGLFIHALIEMDYVQKHPGSFPEYNPNAGTPAPDLYIDIADFTTKEIYEIKHEGEDPRPQLIAGIIAMDIQHRSQGPWQPGRSYPDPSPQIISIWPDGLDPTYNALSDGVWGIEIYLDYAGGLLYKGVPLSGKRRQPVTVAVPGYDPDAIEDFVQQRWPRAGQKNWRKERVKEQLKPPPPYQNPLPGFGTEPSEPSTGVCKVWRDDGVCIDYYQPWEVVPWWAWPFCPWNIPEVPAPGFPIPRLPPAPAFG